MGKPNIVKRMAGIKPCGCTDRFRCEQHWSLMSALERIEFLAAAKRLARGESDG